MLCCCKAKTRSKVSWIGSCLVGCESETGRTRETPRTTKFMTTLQGVSLQNLQTWNDESPGAVYLRPKLSMSILRDTAPLFLGPGFAKGE